MKILVTEAEQRNSLAIIRTLGKTGNAVIAASSFRTAQGLYSRYCEHRVLCPHFYSDPDSFCRFLLQKATQLNADVILPGHEFSVLAFSRFLQNASSPIPIVCPALQAVETTKDKYAMIRLAERLRVPTPKTLLIKESDDLIPGIREIGYPCIIKPRAGFGAIGFSILRSESDRQRFLRKHAASSNLLFNFDHWILQEYIPGPVHDVGLLADNGRCAALLTQKRLRMYPISGGRCVLGETIDEPLLREYSRSLIRELHFHGPAQVEFKYDNRDHIFKLMEINPRFWGSVELGIRAGVDFPALACRLALDGEIDPVDSYQVGLRMHWFWPYELIALFQEAQPFHSWIRFFRQELKGEYDFSLRDPLPVVAQLLYFLSSRT